MKIHTLLIESRQTHALRHIVLRPHQALDQMHYECDDHPQCLHLGAFSDQSDDAKPIGILTLYPRNKPGDGREGDWQLRGMAVDKQWQGRGVGSLLVRQSLVEVRNRQGSRIWCNARDTARGFYTRLGFAFHGDQFEIVDIGPHYLMSISLTPVGS